MDYDVGIVKQRRIISPSNSYFSVTSGFTPVNGETTTWINAVNTAAGSSVVGTTRQQLVDGLITSLKTNSLWTGIDYLWFHCFADENSNEGLIDIKATQACTIGGSGSTLDANGFNGNGTGYLATGVGIPSHFYSGAQSGIITQAFFNNRTTDALVSTIGASNGGQETVLIPLYNGTAAHDFLLELTGGTYREVSNPLATTKGLWTIKRTDASNVEAYYNGNSTTFLANTSPVSTVTQNLSIGCENNNGTPRYFSSEQILFTLIAASLSGANIATQAGILNTTLFNLPVPKNVY